jgi:hypothetical protein
MEWLGAMTEEIRRREQRKTWTYLDHPGPGTNIVGSKWVYRTKRDASGNTTSHCACLVARGFTQQEGVDYYADDTFAAVAKLASARLLLALAARNRWVVHQMDIKSAYLYGKLTDDEVIYLQPPPGITASPSTASSPARSSSSTWRSMDSSRPVGAGTPSSGVLSAPSDSCAASTITLCFIGNTRTVRF